MLKSLKLLVFLVVIISCTSQKETYHNNFYKEVTIFHQNDNSNSIKDIIALHKKGAFSTTFPNQLIYEIKDINNTWLHFKLDSVANKKVFTIWNNFLDYSKLYIALPNGNIIEKREFSLLEKGKFNGNTRKPIWHFTTNESYADVFVKIQDFNLTTNLNLLLLDETEHQDLLQKEDSTILLQSFFLFILFVFIFLIFLARKEYSLLWYSIYILFCLVEYLFHMGVNHQLGILNFPILQSVAQVFLPQHGIFFACLFFVDFYNYNQKTKWVQKVFRIISYYFGFTVICFYTFFIFNQILFPKEIIVYTGRFAAIIILLLHIYLAIKKRIPYYLAVAFNIPIICFFFFVSDRPTFDTSFNQILFADTLFYASTSLEICIVLFFIVKSLIKNEVVAARLKNENLRLMSNFNDSIFKAQETEKQKLLENVHDSFGGYLEALKIRLLQKDNDPSKIQEIINSFYDEYRYLLNSLYSPKINTSNLTKHLADFVSKQNELIGNKIYFKAEIDKLNLQSSRCVHLYRIISELITNSVKHAKATRIDLKIYKVNDSNDIKIEVTDNGSGILINQTKTNSYGLTNVKNRVNAIKGTLDIISNKEQGTSIHILIPENSND